MATQYIEILNVRGPQGFVAAIAEAAGRESLTQSEFVRRVLLDRIQRAGVNPPVFKSRKQEG